MQNKAYNKKNSQIVYRSKTRNIKERRTRQRGISEKRDVEWIHVKMENPKLKMKIK